MEIYHSDLSKEWVIRGNGALEANPKLAYSLSPWPTVRTIPTEAACKAWAICLRDYLLQTLVGHTRSLYPTTDCDLSLIHQSGSCPWIYLFCLVAPNTELALNLSRVVGSMLTSVSLTLIPPVAWRQKCMSPQGCWRKKKSKAWDEQVPLTFGSLEGGKVILYFKRI